ncbi:MAG TPA: alpha/beta fold hydrolase [Opitutaceae bacterium]|nr:alpha/beta fold hydrolase [Opitutaceae bacterium]
MVTTLPAIPNELKSLYPFTPRSLVTPGGASLSYLDEGPRSDHVVLMVHGNPTWSFFYRTLVQALSTRRRCVVPDHIGMGLSEKPQNYDYTLGTRIRDLEALMESLAPQTVDLVVHDWGGAIGFGWAGRHASKIRRIVILNTAAFRSQDIPARIAVCRMRGFGTWLVRGLNGFAGPAVQMAMHRRRLTAQEKLGYLLPYDSWENRVAVNAFVKDIPLSPEHSSYDTLKAVEERLAQFRQHPISLVWGGKDFCFNDHFLARWQEIFPQAVTTRIPDAGHYVLDDGGDQAIQACLAGLEY